MDEARRVRGALTNGDKKLAMQRLNLLAGRLHRHVGREKARIFTALRDMGEFLDELDDLEAEHHQFHDMVANLDVSSADFDAVVMRLFDDLGEHVEREDLGIFPVSEVTLNESGWQLVAQAHTESPTFLLDQIAPADQVERK